MEKAIVTNCQTHLRYDRFERQAFHIHHCCWNVSADQAKYLSKLRRFKSILSDKVFETFFKSPIARYSPTSVWNTLKRAVNAPTFYPINWCCAHWPKPTPEPTPFWCIYVWLYHHPSSTRYIFTLYRWRQKKL